VRDDFVKEDVPSQAEAIRQSGKVNAMWRTMNGTRVSCRGSGRPLIERNVQRRSSSPPHSARIESERRYGKKLGLRV